MLTILKVSRTARRMAWSSAGPATAASVVRKQSMVPMLGWIIPEPLAMPPSRTVLPPSSSSTATSFSTVSVVIIARAAAAEPSLLREAAS